MGLDGGESDGCECDGNGEDEIESGRVDIVLCGDENGIAFSGCHDFSVDRVHVAQP